MKRVFAILLLSCFAAACSEDDDILPQQQERITSYLTTTHAPRLVAEGDVDAGSQQLYYTASGNTVFRYIENMYNPDRENRTEVTPSSVVTITFRAYVFNYQNIVTDGERVTMPYYSNDPLLEEAYVASGLTPLEWKFEPYVVNMSNTEILSGIRLALLGCREGDRAEAYMTYNMAYGDEIMNIVPKQSPLAFFFTVDKVE